MNDLETPAAESPTMKGPIRVLQLEDSADDADLERAQLRRAGLDFTHRRVETRDEFLAALDDFKPHVILADYKLPAFDGRTAVALVQQRHPEIPVIVVSGTLGDEGAVDLLKTGARDFVLKDRLARLGDAVQQALRQERDRHARERDESRLRMFRALLDRTSDGILVLDPRTLRFLDVNQTVCDRLGYSRAELLARTILDFDPGFKPAVLKAVAERLSEAGEALVEAAAHQKDGATYPVELSLRRVKLDRTYVVVTARDITERKRASEALARSEAWFRSLIENISDMVVVLNAEGCITYVSPAVKALGGYEPAELLGKSHTVLTHPDDLEETTRRLASLVRDPDRVVRGEARYRHKDGTWRVAETTDRNLLAVPGVNGIVVTMHDITGRKEAEKALRELTAELQEAQRVAHIGNWHQVLATGEMTWSEEIFRILGRALTGPAPEFKQLAGAASPASFAGMEAAAAECQRTGEPFERDLEVFQGLWINVRGEAIRDSAGTVVALRGTAQDVTDLKAKDAALRAQLDELQRWQDLNLDREDRILELKREVNRALAQAGQRARYEDA